MISLKKDTIELIAEHYQEFTNLVEIYAKKVFQLRHPKMAIEEVESVEIFKEKVWATISYLEEEKNLTLTIDFPVSYMTNREWLETEKIYAKKLIEERNLELAQREKERS